MNQKHTPLEVVHLVEYLRHEAAKPFEVFKDRQKVASLVPGLDRSGISRAMTADVSNPLFRAGLMMLAGARADFPRASGEQIANWLPDVVDLLWPQQRVCIREAFQREQRADGVEDAFQVDYLTDENPEHLDAWLRAAERYRAELDVAIVAARQRQLALQPQGAWAA